MKKYRIGVIDWNKRGRDKLVSMSFADGLRDVRSRVPAKLHYSNSCKCFIGYNNNYEYVVSQI